MSTLESILLILIYSLLSLSFTLCSDSGPCVPQNNCQCIFPSGATLDLSKFNSSQYLIDVPNEIYNDILKIVFTPCKNAIVYNPIFPEIANGCVKGTSVCIVNTTTFIDGGRAEELKFNSTVEWQPVHLDFSKNGWNTKIEVNCTSPNVGTSSTVNVTHFDTVTKTLYMSLKSNDVCIGFIAPTGWGFFSTLFMTVLVGATVYFVGGAILLKFLRGADGVEMIPHYEFWSNLPQHIKNGISFVVNKFETATPYENM